MDINGNTARAAEQIRTIYDATTQQQSAGRAIKEALVSCSTPRRRSSTRRTSRTVGEANRSQTREADGFFQAGTREY